MRIAGTSLRPLEIWRSDVKLEDARDFGSSLLASAVRLGSGARAHDLGPRPHDSLILYELETCPHSRLVREALSELDLDVLIKPCPKGEITHHQELAQYGQTEVPYLIDKSAGVQLSDSIKIVEHLFMRYGNGRPVPYRLRGEFANESSKIASWLRGGLLQYQKPGRRPEYTLELWNYEGSPYCRQAREALGRLALPYVSRNLARNSPRRENFQARFGVMQFPRLDDPNTGIGLFETKAVIAYLETQYANRVDLVGEEFAVHPA
jgi:glutathione S-transferase